MPEQAFTRCEDYDFCVYHPIGGTVCPLNPESEQCLKEHWAQKVRGNLPPVCKSLPETTCHAYSGCIGCPGERPEKRRPHPND